MNRDYAKTPELTTNRPCPPQQGKQVSKTYSSSTSSRRRGDTFRLIVDSGLLLISRRDKPIYLTWLILYYGPKPNCSYMGTLLSYSVIRTAVSLSGQTHSDWLTGLRNWGITRHRVILQKKNRYSSKCLMHMTYETVHRAIYVPGTIDVLLGFLKAQKVLGEVEISRRERSLTKCIRTCMCTTAVHPYCRRVSPNANRGL